MKGKRFTEEQIIGVLKEAEAGAKTKDLCRRHGISDANMVPELRTYRIGLTLAHQYLNQLERDIPHVVLGNVETLIALRLGAEDAVVISRELAPDFQPEDLLNLPNHSIYLKLMIDGTPSRPFSGVTLRPEVRTRGSL